MQALQSKIAAEIAALYPDSGLSASHLETLFDAPPDLKMGDFTLACFRLAKVLRNAPARIADQLANALTGKISQLEKLESVNGYLNFFVSDS